MKLKLTKKGLIGNGLLFFIALVSVAATRHMGNSSQDQTSPVSQEISFDTLLLKLNGASQTEMLIAPGISLNKYAASYVDNYIINNIEDLERIKAKSKFYFQVTDAVFEKY